MKFLSALALVPMLLFAPILAQNTKVQLSVVAPEQTIDSDGNTILPKGGTITDNKHGYSIVASYMRFKDAEFLEAKNALLKNNSGQSIKSPSISHHFKEDKMILAGPLEFNNKEVQGLSAGRAVAFVDAGKLVALGGVRATSPAFAADSIVFDSKSKEALLVGNYSYAKKGLQGKGAKAVLLVDFSKNPDNPSITTKPDAKKLEAYLALIATSSK